MTILFPIFEIPKRRLLKLGVLAIAALIPLWSGVRFLVAMNTEPPVREAQALRGALSSMRRARAREFAPADLKIAEAAVEQALSEYHRTVSEKTGFFRYDLVRRHLQNAHEKVTWAWTRARQRGDTARDYSRKLLHEGHEGIVATERELGRSPIAATVRADLARARVAIGSASSRWAAGDYDAAAREAAFAKSASEDIRGRLRSFEASYTAGAAAQRWSRWVRETIGVSRRTGDYAVVVDKLKHRCYLYRGGALQRIYSADLGGPIHDKLRSGDRATPEGMYRVVRKRGPGQTIYYKALLINYPNDEDRAQFDLAKRKGWISRRSRIGGLIEIHGEGGRKEDWTLGCVALANRDMDELFRVVSVGTPVTIVGTISG